MVWGSCILVEISMYIVIMVYDFWIIMESVNDMFVQHNCVMNTCFLLPTVVWQLIKGTRQILCICD